MSDDILSGGGPWSGGTWAAAVAASRQWAVVDVETSGFRPAKDRVLSVAVLVLDRDGNLLQEYATLLDPGVDPGPVHVHRLTRERLAGSPRFEDVVDDLRALLQERVFVAHNAHFDYEFLAHEFALARSSLPTRSRLCTLALNRALGTPTSDHKLGTLAAYYGLDQVAAHDALDDTRVTAGVLRASLAEAKRQDAPLPFVACPPRQSANYRPRIPKTPCAYRNPGPLAAGGRLVQGMKVAFTGDSGLAREDLTARAVTAGLDVTSSVSGRTSLVVVGDTAVGGGFLLTSKARKARDLGVPSVGEKDFLDLLGTVEAGVRRDGAIDTMTGSATAAPAPPATPAAVPAQPDRRHEATPEPPTVEPLATPVTAPQQPTPAPTNRPAAPYVPRGPMAQRRVLVLGGEHEEAAAVRTRLVGLGAAAAVRLTRGVSDVLLLAEGDADSRMSRIRTLGIPVRDGAWLDRFTGDVATADDMVTATDKTTPAPTVLPRGGVFDLPSGTAHLQLDASWTVPDDATTPAPAPAPAPAPGIEVDIVAFLLDEDEQVARDEDFVFYGQPEHPDGTVRLAADGPCEQSVTLALAELPPTVHRLAICAALDGDATFGDLGPVAVTVAPDAGAHPYAEFTLDAVTTERTLILTEIYRRDGSWRLRAVGQGYDHGLLELVTGYGVDVVEEAEQEA
ncbi:TerD family protein [Streptomyces fractus]|uniref:TerD family protein n=1 Tax=Streptomyces fractus TaxID=641806 RepID=UPI003CE9B3B1